MLNSQPLLPPPLPVFPGLPLQATAGPLLPCRSPDLRTDSYSVGGRDSFVSSKQPLRVFILTGKFGADEKVLSPFPLLAVLICWDK